MASPTEIKSYERIVPMIYAYNTPGVTYNEGWTKRKRTAKNLGRPGESDDPTPSLPCLSRP